MQMKKEEAPGPDGIPTELLQAAVAHRPKLLVDLAYAVHEKGIFTKEHKTARLGLQRKPDTTNNKR